MDDSPRDQTGEIAAAMADPAFYPGPPAAVEVRETHISWVFLTPERAYKLRKPVVYPFLDYGTVERRRRMCEEELRLGRRLAPDLYLGLRAVAADGGAFALAPADRPGALEHVVEMRRFDEDATLAARLRQGAVDAGRVREVARVVARFHAAAEPAPAGSFGPEQVAAVVCENLATLLAHADVVGAGRLAAAHRFAAAFLHGRRELLAARAAGGHVRDCHGDLRAEHVILEPGGIEVFDPVEFDPRLRLIDTGADLAFLAMELEEAGREDLSAALVDAYRAAGGDDGGDALLAFYASYRAWVRAKVACLRADAGGERPRALAALAERLSWRARGPLILVVCGAAATGKSMLAGELAGSSGRPQLSSDAVRKELVGLAPERRAPPAAYSEEASRATYRELGARAAAALPRGGAIVDATFRRRSHRDAFRAGYGLEGPQPVFVECRAPAAVVAERAAGRMGEPGRVSDATPEVAARLLGELEPLDEVPAGAHAAVRTDRPVEATADDVLAALDARLARGG
jgi:aminoglycoside phosphotransferase family enzyme/predicted kinase